MKVRALDENGYPIDHSSVRFRKVIEVPAIPKAEEPLELSTSSGRVLPARVVRADWNEDRGSSCSPASTPIGRSRWKNTGRWQTTPNGS